MLYDNALLILAYFTVYKVSGNESFVDIAELYIEKGKVVIYPINWLSVPFFTKSCLNVI